MAKNLLSSVGNTKTRTFVLFLAAVVIVAAVFIFFRSSSEVDPLQEKTSRTAAIPSSIKAMPGNETPEKYRELQMEDNRRRVLEAYQKKTSAIPTIIGAVSTKNLPDQLDELSTPQNAGTEIFGDTQRGGFVGKPGFQSKAEIQAANKAREDKAARERERINQVRADKDKQREIDRIRKQVADEQARYNESIKQTTKAMQKHTSAIFPNWTSFNTQSYMEGALAKNDGKDKTMHLASGQDGQYSSGSNPLTSPSKEYIKAGAVLFGVIETSVNTDEPSPIMATIVSGRYRGGKLLGKVTHPPRAEKAILSFDTLSLPKYQKSISIKAVAIDPDTARTALASDVDHHYLLRYGSLFASAFMEGYGEAISDAGSTTITSPTGTISSTKADLSGSEQVYAALGEVGKQWAKQAEKIFDIPYTVTIDQGIGVGILFLSDVDVTAPPPPPTPETDTTASTATTNVTTTLSAKQ